MATIYGLPACSCQIKWLPVYTAELKRRGIVVRWVQLIGGSPKSGGTHSTGGASDLYLVSWPKTMTKAQAWLEVVTLARQMGADASWHRLYNWDNDGGEEHCHQVLRGCPHNGPARYQIAAVDAGYNGLGLNGHAKKDDGPRPLSERAWEQGIVWATPTVLVKEDNHHVVTSTRLWGRKTPSATGLKLFSRKKGYSLHTVGYKDLPDGRWHVTAYGTWYPKKHLKLVAK